MFKKIPMSLAVITLFNNGVTEAVQINSIPACDSYDGCKTKTAAADLVQQ